MADLLLYIAFLLFARMQVFVECLGVDIGISSVWDTPLHIRTSSRHFIRPQKHTTQQTNFEMPYFMTLVDSGNSIQFENQFRRFENSNSNENEKKSESRPPSVAERLLSDMDMNVNPCDNFYKFSCGGYIERSNNTDGVSNAFSKPGDRISETVKTELEKELSNSDPKPLLKAKKLYRSCMDENSIERQGIAPVLLFLSDRGGWPVLGSWDYKNFDYIDLLARTRPLIRDYEFHYLPTGAIIGMVIQKDFGKKGQYAIYLDQPSFGQYGFFALPNHEVYRLGKNSIYNKAYEEYLVDIAVALGANPVVANLDMCDVVKFETELAKSALYEEERRRVDIRYNKISILELSLRYPKIDLVRYIRIVLSTANIKIDLNSKVILWAAPYFDRLTKIIANTSMRTLANYILFRTIQPLLPALNRHIQYIYLRYLAVVNGEKEPRLPERSGFCEGVVSNQMDWIASRLFVQNGRYGNTIVQTKQINDFVRSVFTNMIYRADWLSGITKKLVLKKMNAIRAKIGFPKILLNNKYLENYYRHFDIKRNFFGNMEEVITENYRNVLTKLVHPPRDEWLLRPTTVNAVHNLGTTSIEIPLGILDDPFFSEDFPPSMNFGGIGFLIGHEYGHGFEVTGTKFDWNSLIRNYWSGKSMIDFSMRADCLVNQFSNFYIPEADLLVVNGNKTLNENIPDLVGVQAGFQAYRKWKRTMNVKDFVKELPFTGEQLYFINMARTWCIKASPVFLQKFPLLDHHALNALRVIGPLQNSPEFSSVFQCPLGSFMNPSKKCRFW